MNYYVRQCDPENFNFAYYYDEGAATDDLVWVGGNRNLVELNSELRSDVADAVDNFISDIDGTDDWNITTEYAQYYFGGKRISENRSLTDDEVEMILTLTNEYMKCTNSNKEDQIICSLLSIIYETPFTHGTIRGCCQSDWLDYICPADFDISFVESVLFGMGTELEYTIEPIDSDHEFEESETCFFYTPETDPNKIKAAAAKEIGCEISEIVLMMLEDIRIIKKYIYKNY